MTLILRAAYGRLYCRVLWLYLPPCLWVQLVRWASLEGVGAACGLTVSVCFVQSCPATIL